MKIKRYFAPDIKQAIRMVREEQGPDAVILSNRKVDGGVEIVAAKDFDEHAMMEQLPGASGQAGKTAAANPARTESQRRADEVFREALGTAQAGGGFSTPTPPTPPAPARPTAAKTAAPMPRRNAAPPPPAKTGGGEIDFAATKALLALQKEMRQMRRMMDSHFSETAWESTAARAPTRLDILRRLSARGFTKNLSLQLANRLGGCEDLDIAWQSCRDLLASQLPVAEDNLLEYGGIAALVGPTGVGKTTTVAKLAARFRLKHGPRQVALITTDNFRIAAHDQLAAYGRILDVPVRVASNGEELRNLLSSFYDKRLVLIDTAGMGQRDMRLAQQFAMLRQHDMPIKSYLVLSAASQARVMKEAISAFAGFAPQACILTKLDETAYLGAALCALIEQQLPVAMVSDGQQVPEDLHMAKTHLLLEQCFADSLDESEDDAPTRAFSHEDWTAHANV